MTIKANGSSTTGSSTPSSYNYSESYKTVYASSSTYKVTIATIEGGNNITATAWILKNGTTIAIDISGQNLTGVEVGGMATGFLSAFTLQIQEDSLITFYTGQNYFHSTGTSTINIGPTPVSVTTYAANNIPETFVDCNGVSTTLTAYSFSVGTPHGASIPLVVAEHFAGSDVNNGQTTTYNYQSQVTSITLA